MKKHFACKFGTDIFVFSVSNHFSSNALFTFLSAGENDRASVLAIFKRRRKIALPKGSKVKTVDCSLVERALEMGTWRFL